MTELRMALAEVYQAWHLPVPTYPHPSIAAGQIIYAVDLAELRAAVRAVEGQTIPGLF